MSKIQLNERLLEKVEMLKEELPKGIIARIKYPIMRFGVKNANNRIYEREVADVILNNENIKNKLKTRTLFGNAEHPNESQVKLNKDETSHIISSFNINEKDKVLEAILDLLPTEAGKFINVLLEAGCLVGTSTRADGELEEKMDETGGKYNRVIPSSYLFQTLDFTGDPSTPDAIPENIIKAVENHYASKDINKNVAVALLETVKTEASKKMIENIKNDKQHEGCKNSLKDKHCVNCNYTVKEEVQLEVNIDKQVEEFLKDNRENFKDDIEARESLIKVFKITPEKADEYVKKMIKGETPMEVEKKVVKEDKKVYESKFDDVIWDVMIKDPEAKEFVRVHSQILNGGFSQLFMNERDNIGRVEYLLDEAEIFINKYAPIAAKTIDPILNKYYSALNNLPSSKLTDEDWEEFNNGTNPIDSEYYKFYEAMEEEIAKNYSKVKESNGLRESYINEIINLSQKVNEGIREQEEIFNLLKNMFKLQKTYNKQDIIKALKDYIHEYETMGSLLDVSKNENKQLKEEFKSVKMAAEKAAKLEKELEEDEKEIASIKAEMETTLEAHKKEIAILKENHNKDLVKMYSGIRVKALGLNLPKQLNTLLEACKDIDEVDKTIRSIQNNIRESILINASLDEVNVENEIPKNDKQLEIDKNVERAFKGFGM